MTSRLPDYRSRPMTSPEGAGEARERRVAWIASVPPERIAEANAPLPWETTGFQPSELGPPLLKWVIEESDLVGFWIAWHAAGGFEGLEVAGWNRATIFRKVRAFRSYFGAHPDSHRFGWLELDLDRFWAADLADRLALHRDQDAAGVAARRRPPAEGDLDAGDARSGDQA